MRAVQRRRQATQRAIERNPVDLVLTRKQKMTDPGGGYRIGSSVDLPPQRVRLHLTGVGAASGYAKEGGQALITRPSLLAMHDADIRRDDTFERDGKLYRVVRVQVIRLYGEPVSLQCEVEEVE